jgi:hypothetical protein
LRLSFSALQAGDRHSIDLKAEAIPAYEVVEVKDAPKSAVDQWATGGGLHHSRYSQVGGRWGMISARLSVSGLFCR